MVIVLWPNTSPSSTTALMDRGKLAPSGWPSVYQRSSVVVIGDPDSKTIRFASPSPTNQYPWHRESKLPDSHAIWRAVDAGQYRGQGPVIWPSGQARELWIDAVAHGREVHAVFTEHRHWKASGLSVLDGGVRQARGTAYSGTCRRCNKANMGIPTPRAMWRAVVQALREVRMRHAVTPRTEDAGLHPLRPYEALGPVPERRQRMRRLLSSVRTLSQDTLAFVVPEGIPFASWSTRNPTAESGHRSNAPSPPEFLNVSNNGSSPTVCHQFVIRAPESATSNARKPSEM